MGIIGCLSLAYFFLSNLVRCIQRPFTGYRILLLASFTGFLVINLGTMPLWQIEGMVLFATLNALTWELNLTRPESVANHSAERDIPVLRRRAQVRGT